MSTVVTNIRIDKELKAQATELFNDLGLTLSQAFTVFLKQAVLHHGLPFAVTRPPSKELLEAIREGEQLAHDPNAKTYASPKELWDELGIYKRLDSGNRIASGHQFILCHHEFPGTRSSAHLRGCLGEKLVIHSDAASRNESVDRARNVPVRFPTGGAHGGRRSIVHAREEREGIDTVGDFALAERIHAGKFS